MGFHRPAATALRAPVVLTLTLALLTGVLLAGALLAGPAAADGPPNLDPDWPCVQRKVPELSYGTVWTGPSLEDLQTDWEDDEAVRGLVNRLALRRTSLEDAKAMIESFAEELPAADKERKLTLVFAGLFEKIDDERGQIIDGIGRYSRKQKALSKRISDTNAEIRLIDAKSELTDADEAKLRELENKLEWDERIFVEREQSLTYVCESPVLLEQRLFALARAIQQHL